MLIIGVLTSLTQQLTQGDTEAQEPAASLHAWHNPLRDKICEVVRGLLLADTQTGRYGRLYSRRRLRARRVAEARLSFRSFLNCCDLFASPRTNPDTDTGTGPIVTPIPPVTVFRVKDYIGGVLARALTEELRYLST